MLQTNAVDQTCISSPFALFEFLLKRLGETRPCVFVDTKSYRRFHRSLHRVSAFTGETIPAAMFLHGLHLEEVCPSTTDTVRVGIDLLRVLRARQRAIWAEGFDTRTTINSVVVSALRAWMADPNEDPFIEVECTADRMRVRSRPALTRQSGITINVDVNFEALDWSR